MVELIPATGVKSRNVIRVHNEAVAVLSVKPGNDTIRIRYATAQGNSFIDVASDSLVPRFSEE